MSQLLSLPVVEALLQEFYLPATPNARKHEIETQLVAFKSQPDAWQSCLRLAAEFNCSPYLWFFSTATVEHAITRRWNHLTSAQRCLLRETLWQNYANLAVNTHQVSKGQRDTFAKLIALMGKREFPDDHPNYVQNCIELIKSKFALGICLLRNTSEEAVSNRQDMTTEQKNYFHSYISMCMPELLELLTKFLLIAVCHINGKDFHSMPNDLIDLSLVNALPNDNQFESSLLELLACVQHLVSWIPTNLISDYFLMSIFDMSRWRQTHEDVALASLSILLELLYLQKPLPNASMLMNGMGSLLDVHNASSKSASEMYADKFRELLRLYTAKYWPKLLQDNAQLDSFLKSLYLCTVNKNGALDFTEKLEIWNTLIKGMAANSKLLRYHDIVHQLVAEIMRRTQFEYNKDAELEILDNEVPENNTQTEWQQFLTQCFETVALVAESRPNAIFAQVFSYWSRPHVYLQSLENEIDSAKYNELSRKLKSQSFSEHLRDFSTVCQAVVRIAPLLNINALDVGTEVHNQLQLLIDNLLSTLQFLSSNKIYCVQVERSSYQTDYDYLYAQILMALRSVFPLVVSLKSEQTLRSVFEQVAGIFLPGSLAEPIVYMAASQLLLCITTVIRPKYLLEITDILKLLQAGAKIAHLPKQVIANVHTSLIAYLVLPWKDVPEQQQDYTRRFVVLREYVDSLAKHFLQIDLQVEAKVSAANINLLSTFSMVIEHFTDASNTAKDMLANAFKPIITKSLMLFNNFGMMNQALAIAVAELALSLLRTLQNQFGSQFIKEMITLFIAVGSREQLTLHRCAVVEKILLMFKIIAEQPGNASLSMLPAIIDFTIAQIVPLLQNQESQKSDIYSLVFALFDSILLNKWQYFYKSHVQHNGSLHQQSGDNLHPEHFVAIMNAYGQVLVIGNDPSVVHTVLTSMQNVNDRWRLYQRPAFKDTLLANFQNALITVLFSGEGAMHFELLAHALFAMGQVDTLKLRESFAAAGIPVSYKAIDEICLSTDIPTFSHKLSQLVQDVHCIHLTQA